MAITLTPHQILVTSEQLVASGKIQIGDHLGRSVRTSWFHGPCAELTTKGLPGGVYQVHVWTPDQTSQQTITIP